MQGKRPASASAVAAYTNFLKYSQAKKCDGLRSGDRAGHAMSPLTLTLTFCCISYWAVTHTRSVTGHVFLHEYFYYICYVEHPIQFYHNSESLCVM